MIFIWQELVARGAAVNVRSDRDMSALAIAAENGRAQIADVGWDLYF